MSFIVSPIAQWTKAWAEQRDKEYVFYSETSSTNDSAKQGSFEKEKIFIAEQQTQGRGRGDRKWINSDLMITWGFVLTKPPQPVTVHLMAEALYIALTTVFSPKEDIFIIKKPNDIFIQNKKMAGILIEVVNKGLLHKLIIGAGMNVFSHPDHQAICLQKHIKQEISKKNWFYFMDEWQKQIKEKIPHCL